MKLFLHVTDLDAWKWFKELDSMSDQDMVARLTRTDSPKPIMLAGSAWHKVLESPPDVIETIEMDGFKFDVQCDASISLPNIREIRQSKTYTVDNVQVTLSGGCDGISGNKVTDHKLSFNPDPERYFFSPQWRCYLDIYNADMFEYVIYHAFSDDTFREILIREVSTITMYRYSGMIEDILAEVRELLHFIKSYAPQMIS